MFVLADTSYLHVRRQACTSVVKQFLFINLFGRQTQFGSMSKPTATQHGLFSPLQYIRHTLHIFSPQFFKFLESSLDSGEALKDFLFCQLCMLKRIWFLCGDISTQYRYVDVYKENLLLLKDCILFTVYFFLVSYFARTHK